MVTTWSDSLARAQYGQRQNFFLGSFFINYYPQYFVSYRDHSRSGWPNEEMVKSRMPLGGIPDAGASYGKTNGLNIFYVSGNVSRDTHEPYNSNSIYGFFKEILQYPTNTFNRFGIFTNDWSQPNAEFLYQSIVIGDIPYNTADGYPPAQDYSYGGRSAAFEDGVPFVDSWSNLVCVMTNAYANGPNLWFPPNFDHPGNDLQLVWDLTNLRSLEVDTNTYTAIIDFNAATVSATNHCAVTDLSLNTNTLTFTFHADRMAPGFYVPDGTITNDCRGAFALMPSLGNQFCEILRVTNLPAGNYELDIDGSNVVTLSSAQLSAGYNGFTNYNGAFWAQKKEILGLMCDMLDVLRSDASSDAHPGDNRLIEKYESYGAARWPTDDFGVDEYIAQMSDREVELQAEDILIHAAAQQTNHIFTLTLLPPPRSIWTGGPDGAGTDIGQGTNWSNSLPSAVNNETAEWNGTEPGDLFLNYDFASLTSGFEGGGLNLYLNSAQTGSVSIATTLTSTPTLAVQNILIDTGAGAFTFGGSDTYHRLNWIGRPSGVIHSLINNSTNTATLTPWISFTAGGGSTWGLDFSGTGDWQCDSYLNDDEGQNRILQIDGPGTVFWNPTGVLGSSGIASPISINGGALILRGPHPRLDNQAIVINGNFTFALTNPAAAQTLSGPISGAGTLNVSAGTLTLTASNTFTGSTTVSNGTLVVASSLGGDLNLDGGTFAVGDFAIPAAVHIGGDLNMTAGTILFPLNESSAQSNSFIMVDGGINFTSGTLQLLNTGTSLAVGDTFQLFNQPVIGGASITISSSRFAVTNNLEVDGSVSVISIVPPPTLSFTNDGDSLQFAWSNDVSNFKLQMQTNLPDTNWVDYPGGETSPVVVPIDSTMSTVFFRLAPAP